MYDPMLNFTVDKLTSAIKCLRHLDKYPIYKFYAPKIAESMSSDIKSYLDYLLNLGNEPQSKYDKLK